MARGVLRAFLLVYFLMPVATVLFVVLTFVQIRSDIAPIYEAASASITRATHNLNTELSGLSENFRPLADTVNAIRSALQTVINFLRDTVYTVIDVVNGLNLACSIGGAACIPKSLNVTLPTLVDLSFLDDIAANITVITTDLNNVVTTTTSAISAYLAMLLLAVGIFVVWILLSYVLFMVFLYQGLWKNVR